MSNNMFLLLYNKKWLSNFVLSRNFKNFGHKRQPVPRFTFWWHGFLTFTFIGLGIEWKRIGTLIFGQDDNRPESSIK